MVLTRDPLRVDMLLFEGVEVLDFAGPYEVLACSKDAQGRNLATVRTLAPDREIRCTGGLVVRAEYLLADNFQADAPKADVLIVPGGPGARLPREPERIAAHVRTAHAQGLVVASVCTGAYLLARAGLLDGLQATTHSAWLEDFASRFPKVRALPEKIVDQGRVLTAAGVSSGVDLALYLLERFFGPEERRREAARLEGPWL